MFFQSSYKYHWSTSHDIESGRCNRSQETRGSHAVFGALLYLQGLYPEQYLRWWKQTLWQLRLFNSRQPDIHFFKVVDSLLQISWGFSLKCQRSSMELGGGGRSTFQHWPSPMNKPLTRLRRRRKAFRAEDAACKWKRVSAMLALKIKDSSGLASKARRDFLLCYYLTGLLPLLCLQIHKSSLFDAYKVKTKFSFQNLLSIPLKKSRTETPHTLFF